MNQGSDETPGLSLDTRALRQRWPRPCSPRPIVLIGGGGIVNDAHLPAYRAIELEVSGIHDPDHERARATAERWEIPGVHATLADALASDAIFDIAVPPGAVFEVVSALPEGSACLIQKPLGLNLEDATRIRCICRERKLTAAVNFQLRFSPMMLALQALIEAGRLGRLIELDVHINCRMPWHLWPFMKTLEHMEVAMHSIHYLDAIRGLLGNPRGVWAQTVKHPEAMELDSSRTSAILDYGDDIRCCLSVNHHHQHGERFEESSMRIEGTQGAAVLTLGVNLDYPRGRPDTLDIALEGTDWVGVPLEGHWFPDAFRGPMSNLQRFVAGDDPLLVTAVEDAWHTMALVEACYDSTRAGSTPLADDPFHEHGHSQDETR